jgi:hypothetical protein
LVGRIRRSSRQPLGVSISPDFLKEPSLFPGARWWKCDLHVHTPFSKDYKSKKIDCRSWLDAVQAAGLDMVAVTDHNGSDWVRKLREAGLGNLVVLPGCELTLEKRVHFLALFDSSTSDLTVNAMLLNKEFGLTESQLGCPDAQVYPSCLTFLENVGELGCLAIAAHANQIRGVLKTYVDARLEPVSDVTRFLRHPALSAIETVPAGSCEVLETIVNSRFAADFAKLTLLESSDAHCLEEIGQRFTWIKMGTPQLQELRLALQDGPSSVVPKSKAACNPNLARANYWIREIEISGTKYFGRLKPFLQQLSPWMNSFVGSRGTGKSSLVEFLRLAFRRQDELKQLPSFQEFARYGQVFDRKKTAHGLLLANASFQVVVEKEGHFYKICWAQSANTPSIQEWNSETDQWIASAGEVAQRFPIRILSQGQIYDLAQNPKALMQLLDEAAPEVGAIKAQLDQLALQYRAKRAEAIAASAPTSAKQDTQARLNEMSKRLEKFEQSNFRIVLQNYKRLQKQRDALTQLHSDLKSLATGFREHESQFEVPAFDLALFEGLPVFGLIESSYQSVESQILAASQLYRSCLEILEGLPAQLKLNEERSWVDYKNSINDAYRSLESEGAQNPEQYETMLKEKNLLDQRLKEIMLAEKRTEQLELEAESILISYLAKRAELTQVRREFVQSNFKNQSEIQLEVKAFGDQEQLEASFRTIFSFSDATFEDEFPSTSPDESSAARVLDSLYEGVADGSFLAKLQDLKEGLLSSSNPLQVKQQLVTRLKQLTASQIDELRLCMPEDRLELRYRNSPRAQYQTLQEGSPGQRAAAVLCFLLSHGDSPLILDQPEDDLDNQLISQLVVESLKKVKLTRQVIIVTHNPNLVVNTDSELVIALEAKAGQTYATAGALQNPEVRDRICRVVEGGRDALEKRYRRMTTAYWAATAKAEPAKISNTVAQKGAGVSADLLGVPDGAVTDTDELREIPF